MNNVANNKIQANSLAGNKIKAKPEVGYVWETDGHDLIKIIETNERFSICLIKDSEGYHIHPILNPFFMQYGKLLGRNSITLDDLFKTENE